MGPRQGARGVGRQGHRRGDVGNDGEVEHEHVGRQRGEAELGEEGHPQGGGEDVGPRGGEPHAQDQGDHHDEDQGEEGHVPGEGEDEPHELEAEPREGHGPHHDACGGAGDADQGDVFRPHVDGVQDLPEAHAVLGIEEGDPPGEPHPHHRRQHGGVPRQKEIDHASDGEHEIELAAHDPQLRELCGSHAPKTVLQSPQVHHEEHRSVVHQGGENRRHDDVFIRHPQERGHDEGSRSHDRGHDLPSGTRHGLHGPGEGGRIADALHERNGEGPRAVNVGHGGARDGAEEARTHHGDLGGPPRLGPREGLGELHEPAPDAALFQKAPEDEKDHDVGRRDPQRNGKNPLVGEVDLLDDLPDGKGEPFHDPRHVVAEVHVPREEGGDEGQGPPHHPAGGFEEQHQQEPPQKELNVRHGVHLDDAGGDFSVVEGAVNPRHEGDGGETPVVPGNGPSCCRRVGGRGNLAGRSFQDFSRHGTGGDASGIEEKGQGEHPGQVEGALQIGLEVAEDGGIEMKNPHDHHIDVHKPGGKAPQFSHGSTLRISWIGGAGALAPRRILGSAIRNGEGNGIRSPPRALSGCFLQRTLVQYAAAAGWEATFSGRASPGESSFMSPTAFSRFALSSHMVWQSLVTRSSGRSLRTTMQV